MTDPKTETVWITIPDEAAPASGVSASVGKPIKTVKRGPAEKVKNRAFWGVGFVILMVFLSLLLAPQQFASFLQGNLFDGGFEVVPDYETQGGALFGDGTETDEELSATSSSTTTDSGDENVVEAESDAVSIQIEPVANGTDVSGNGDEDMTTDTSTTTTTTTTSTTSTTSTDTDTTSSDSADTGAETILIDSETGAIVTTGTEGDISDTEGADTGLSADGTDLLQSLSKQLNDFKEKEQQNEQLIQELMQMLEDQASGLHGSATDQQGATFLPTGETGTGTGVNAGFGLGSGAGVYRYNTHTVSVSPYDILAQNKAATQASYQANVTYTTAPSYSQQTYNPVLAGVQGQPGTGPAETILFAFAIASLGILVWGFVRAIRA